jgi:hypothetical protein
MSSSAGLRHDYLMFSYVYKGLDAPQYSSLLAPISALCKRDINPSMRSAIFLVNAAENQEVSISSRIILITCGEAYENQYRPQRAVGRRPRQYSALIR